MSEKTEKVVGFAELKQMMDKKYGVEKPSWDEPEYVAYRLLLSGFLYSGKNDTLSETFFKGQQAVNGLMIELEYPGKEEDTNNGFAFTNEEYNEIADRMLGAMVVFPRMEGLLVMAKGYKTLDRMLKQVGKRVEVSDEELEAMRLESEEE